MKSITYELRECPFCGQKTAKHGLTTSDEEIAYRHIVICTCGASSKTETSREKAEAEWNSRAAFDFETDPATVIKGFEAEENDAVAALLRGIPPGGGSMSKELFERLIRMSFQGGLAAAQGKKN